MQYEFQGRSLQEAVAKATGRAHYFQIKQDRQATHYIWRTRRDGRVRSEHASREGMIFAWNDPPPDGHPGEDYNCRCRAEPIEDPEKSQFDEAIRIIQAEIAVFAREGIWNDSIRRQYQDDIGRAVRDLEAAVLRGELSWGEAARQASQHRNDAVQRMRARSTVIGDRIARTMKPSGPPFDEIVERNRSALAGSGEVRDVPFDQLSDSEQDKVLQRSLQRSGMDNAKVSNTLRRFSQAGRGLAGLSVALSVYNIYNADDPAAQALEEVTIGAAGAAGGWAGAYAGAAAGGVIGSVVPVIGTAVGAAAGAVVGALSGGAAGGYGASQLFD